MDDSLHVYLVCLSVCLCMCRQYNFNTNTKLGTHIPVSYTHLTLPTILRV